MLVELSLNDLVEAAIDGGKAVVHLFTETADLIVQLGAEALCERCVGRGCRAGMARCQTVVVVRSHAALIAVSCRPVEGDKGRVRTTVEELIRWGTIVLGLTAAYQEQYAVALIAGLVLLLQTLIRSKDPPSTYR